jgi:hypothetical protein
MFTFRITAVLKSLSLAIAFAGVFEEAKCFSRNG